MALDGNLTYVLPEEFMNSLSNFVDILQALGIVVLVYLIFNIINLFINRKKRDEMKKINENLEDIKKLLSKKNKK